MHPPQPDPLDPDAFFESFWSVTARRKFVLITSWDTCAAVLVAALSALFLPADVADDLMPDLAWAGLATGAGLLGVLIAAIAITAATWSLGFIEWAVSISGSLMSYLWPFAWAAFAASVAIVGCAAAAIVGEGSEGAARWSAVAVLTLLTYATFASLSALMAAITDALARAAHLYSSAARAEE